MTVIQSDKERVMKAFNSLKEQINRAKKGEISFSEVLYHLNIHNFLPDGDLIPTIWSIEDIRDRFPFYTTDEQLTAHLNSIKIGLQIASIETGWDVIRSQLGDVYEDKNEPILHIQHLTPKDQRFLQKHIYPAFQAQGYPVVEYYGNLCHVIPQRLWDNVKKQIEEWNVKHKLQLTACFYTCKTSELRNPQLS